MGNDEHRCILHNRVQKWRTWDSQMNCMEGHSGKAHFRLSVPKISRAPIYVRILCQPIALPLVGYLREEYRSLQYGSRVIRCKECDGHHCMTHSPFQGFGVSRIR